MCCKIPAPKQYGNVCVYSLQMASIVGGPRRVLYCAWWQAETGKTCTPKCKMSVVNLCICKEFLEKQNLLE